MQGRHSVSSDNQQRFHHERSTIGERVMRKLASLALCGIATLTVAPSLAEQKVSTNETKQIAEEAFVYGLPLVMNYTVFYKYFVDKTGADFKAPPNQIYNTANVYTPADTA